MIIYMDGVFDLFHVGHLDAIKQCYKLGDNVLIGVVSDSDAESYKRIPIINEQMRCEIIESCKYVSNIIFPAPLIPTIDFIHKYNIGKVVHAFADDHDFEKQKDFFTNINLHRIDYSSRISTTDIIHQIKNNN